MPMPVIVGGFDGARHAHDLRIAEQETDGGIFPTAGRWAMRDKHPSGRRPKDAFCRLDRAPRGVKGIAMDDKRWDLLVHRDGGSDGSFFYGVKTTGIFCRPACPSRLPRRGNVRFFTTVREARQAGFRPCRRCRPEVPSRAEPHIEKIVRACELIREAEEPPTLARLAEAVSLSPYHFHRVFKRAVGITPKGYAAAIRAERLKEGLSRGMSVTRAIHDAGFGSSSRLYAETGEVLGMSPSEFRSGAAGIPIRFAAARTALGWVLVAATARGICAIDLGDSRDALIGNLRRRFKRAELWEEDPEFLRWVDRVRVFVESPRSGLDLPLDIRGTAFQRRVWQELRAIPPGRTANYSEIARRIGVPRAARAVARACAANALAAAIPCHRVVRKDGGPGGYRWGIAKKRALLEREAAGPSHPKRPFPPVPACGDAATQGDSADSD
jgi:AraC family transcriptional regulator, regulatory protein of adaptative response / methylated-DNA-[protein]-cysteine methyltransferase